MKKLCLIACLVLFLLATSSVTARTITVDDDSPADFNNIQAAINDANNGDTVLVADGTYTGTGNKNLDFGGLAIMVQSENGPENCMIDCQNSGRGFIFQNSEEPNSIVSGFTIKRGEYLGYGGGIYCSGASPTIQNCIITDNSAYRPMGDPHDGDDAYGGGIYCTSNSNPTISNCTVSNNKAEGGDALHGPNGYGNGGYAYGGGIYCDSNSNVAIISCTIEDNICEGGRGGLGDFGFGLGGNGNGGGIFCSSDSTLTIEDCRIVGNTAKGGYGGGAGLGGWGDAGGDVKGGGIDCRSVNPTIIKNCNIIGNTAESGRHSQDSKWNGNSYGGGVYGSFAMSNCKISNNSSLVKQDPRGYPDKEFAYGGGIYCTDNATIKNCLITSNIADDRDAGNHGNYGGAIYAKGVATITNCTISGNTAINDTGGVYCEQITLFTSCILWQNDGNDIDGIGAVVYSNIEDSYPGTGNISSDPCFVSGSAGDYYLSQIAAGQDSDSPCIDAGRYTAAYLALDTRTTRTDQAYDTGTVDMGYHSAYYYPLPTGEQCDIDGDGDVDMVDLSIMGNQWQQTPGVPSADITPVGGDWKVDINDLASLIDYWMFGATLPADINRPLAWWKFDEGTGIDANDSAGSNDGTLVGDPNWVTGKIGSWALEFDGTGDYVDIQDADSLTPSDQITIAYWIYKRSGQTAGIYKYGSCPNESNSPGNSRAYYLVINDSTSEVVLTIFSSVSNYDTVTSNSLISPNQWYHIAATFDQGDTSIYIDGQPDSVSTMSVSSIMNDAQPLIIGGYWNYCGTDNFVTRLDGKIDDVRIYNVALGTTEIQQLYEQGL